MINIIEWRPIVGYEGLYEVSNTGLVRSCDRYDVNGRLWKCKSIKDKINKHGYHIVCLCNAGKRKYISVYKLVYESFIGKIPEGYQINHINEDKNDNTVWNLNLMTPKENANWGTRNSRIGIGVSKSSKGKRFGENNSFYGKHHSKESIDKIKKAKEEYYKTHDAAFKGKHHTVESKALLSTAHDKYKTKVAQYNLNGVLLAYYDSQIDASRSSGVRQGSISLCINNKSNTAGGYIWKKVIE